MILAAFGLAALLQLSALLIGPPRGLHAEYVAGPPPTPPTITDIDRQPTTRALQLRWAGAPPSTFRVQWSGFVVIPRTGSYTFALTSDDGGQLLIDGWRLIDNSGRHEARTVHANVALQRGLHPLRIELVQEGGDYAIDLLWRRGGSPLRRVPAWALSPTQVSDWRVTGAHALEMAALAALAVGAVLLGMGAWIRRAAVAHFPRAASLAVFVGLALLNTWPLATDPGHLTRHDNRDTMLNEWIVAWVAHQAPRDPLHLFDGNIFHPEPDTLAYSEAMLPQGAMAIPLLALGASPVLTYNLLLIAGFILSGWSMCLVVQKWTGDWMAGLVAGTSFAFNAHLMTRLPHLQAQHVEFLPLALYALDALLRQPSTATALKLALWSVLQATTSVYLLAITMFALVAGVLSRPREWMGDRFAPVARALLITSLLSATVIVPFLWPYYQANHDQGLTRSLSDAAMYSATWKDYLSTPSRIHYTWWSERFFVGTALFPGGAALLLTLLAIVRGRALKDLRVRMCLALGVAGVLLSLGPSLPGYSLLYTVVPVLRGIRATARFGYLATVAAAAIAGFGVVTLRRLTPARSWPVVAGVLLTVTALELVVAPLGLARFDGIAPIYASIRNVSGARVVEFPFWGPRSAQFHASYMLNSTKHWKPIVNGYSGFQPRSFYEHAEVLQEFPSAEALVMLRSLGITHLFVHEDQMSADALSGIRQRTDLRLIDRFGSIALYRTAF